MHCSRRLCIQHSVRGACCKYDPRSMSPEDATPGVGQGKPTGSTRRLLAGKVSLVPSSSSLYCDVAPCFCTVGQEMQKSCDWANLDCALSHWCNVVCLGKRSFPFGGPCGRLTRGTSRRAIVALSAPIHRSVRFEPVVGTRPNSCALSDDRCRPPSDDGQADTTEQDERYSG